VGDGSQEKIRQYHFEIFHLKKKTEGVQTDAVRIGEIAIPMQEKLCKNVFAEV